MLELAPAPPGAKPRLGHGIKGSFTTSEALAHEAYTQCLSGEINVADIDPSTGSHDELSDWAYPKESELFAVEQIINAVFNQMLEHVGEVLNEQVDPKGEIVSDDQMHALGVLASSLGTDNTVTQLEAGMYAR